MVRSTEQLPYLAGADFDVVGTPTRETTIEIANISKVLIRECGGSIS